MRIIALLLCLMPVPVLAQGMKMDDMSGMAMPAKKLVAKKPKPKKPAPAPQALQSALQPVQPMPGMAAKPAPVPQAMPAMAMPQDDKSEAKTRHDMAGMDMSASGADHAMTMHGLLGGYGMSREASGTSWQLEAAPHGGFTCPRITEW